MSRVLLTGGAGFIGSALARALVDRGDQVVVLDKLTYAGRRQNLAGVDAELVVGDVCDGALVASLVDGVDAVVHAAAESHVARSLEDPGPFLRTNIDGTRVMLEQSARAGVPHFVHVSTDEVFGSAPEGVEFGIDAPLRPGNLYAASKASAEAMVHAIAHTRGYRATMLRCTNNYGPRQHEEKAIPCWTRAARAGGAVPIHGDGSAVRDWLHVDDFAAGVLAVLRHGEPGRTWHFSGGNSRANLDVATRVIQLVGGGTLAHEADRAGQDARYALDDAASRAELGWSPQVAFAQGLADTVAWYGEAEPRKAAP